MVIGFRDYLDPSSKQDDKPKAPNVANKALILRTFGVLGVL